MVEYVNEYNVCELPEDELRIIDCWVSDNEIGYYDIEYVMP
jgi:hypothetical protein